MSEYSLGARCLAEFLGSMFLVALGTSAIANEVLPNTKAHGGGFLNVALAFGFGVFLPLACFGHVSAQINPAVSLALVATGDQDLVTFLAFSSVQVAGCFCGAVVMWLSYLPHFKTVPEPPPTTEASRILRTTDVISEDARLMAGFNTNKGPATGGVFRDLVYYFNPRNVAVRDASDSTRQPQLVSLDDAMTTRKGAYSTSRIRKLVPTASRLKRLVPIVRRIPDAEGTTAAPAPAEPANPFALLAEAIPEGEAVTITIEDAKKLAAQDAVGKALGAHPLEMFYSFREESDLGVSADSDDGETGEASATSAESDPAAEAERLFNAAVDVDMTIKLVAFCTRPAIYSPFFNMLVEAIATWALVMGAFLINARIATLPEDQVAGYKFIGAFFIGWLVVGLVLAFGGPTGFATNPARDLGPRIAHFLLPIPGKGSSEWHYSWVPIVGPFIGAVVGGLMSNALGQFLVPM